MWCLIFLIILLIFSYPFLISYEIKFNLLKMKGVLNLCLLGKIKIQFKVRVKNGYIYIYHNRKEQKFKLTDQSFNVIFFLNFIKQIYFRHQLLVFDFFSNFGYSNNACVTAVGAGCFDVVGKSVLSKVQNNKKSAHIFVNVEPKYNEDVLSIRAKSSIRISIWDLAYSLGLTLIKSWRNYEKNRKNRIKQG